MSIEPEIWVGIPCLLLGGTEVATLGMVRALVEDGRGVSVCCYHEWDAAMVERYRKAGAEVELLEHPRGDLPGLFRRLVRFFRERRPRVAHIQYMAPGLLPILAARWARVPTILATVHAAGSNGYGWRPKAMLRTGAALTDHFFCVSENTERFWFGAASGARTGSERRATRHSTVYNGVDVDAIRAAGWNLDRACERAAFGLPADALVVGIVGRVVRLKGHDTLFRALNRLRDAWPGLRVLVVGGGPDRPFFERVAAERGISDRVIWAGAVEPENLPTCYHLMDVLTMPSRWEGFGLTAAEAMAAGVPVVGSDVPGLREVLDNGRVGMLFPTGDAKTLAECLEALLSDSSRRQELGAAGQTFVQVQFSRARATAQWQEAYESLVPVHETGVASGHRQKAS